MLPDALIAFNFNFQSVIAVFNQRLPYRIIFKFQLKIRRRIERNNVIKIKFNIFECFVVILVVVAHFIAYVTHLSA